MQGKQDRVGQCLRQIEKKLGWGNPEGWHSDMFTELSERIHQDTGVLLSPTTLKRVWGKVNYRNAPSITTLNTLARFAGYQNWRDFKGEQSPSALRHFRNTVRSHLGIIVLAASVMTLAFLSFYSLRPSDYSDKEFDFSGVRFRSRPIAKGLPNSVVFDLELPGIRSDCLFIQQYWDPTKTIRLKRGQQTATAQYYFPGHFRAKLLVDGRVVTEHGLLIPSNGWVGIVEYTPVPTYVYVKDSALISDSLSLSQLLKEEVQASETPLVSGYHWVGDEGNSLPGDSFRLQAVIRHTFSDTWGVCQKMGIYLLGTEGVMVLPFSIPGCISEIGVSLSERFLSGKEHDLSALGTDWTRTREVDVTVKDKHVRIAADGQELLSATYKKSMGRLVGVRFLFLGTGVLTHCAISNLEGTTYLMKDDFLK